MQGMNFLFLFNDPLLQGKIVFNPFSIHGDLTYTFYTSLTLFYKFKKHSLHFQNRLYFKPILSVRDISR